MVFATMAQEWTVNQMMTPDRQYKILTEHIRRLENKGAPWHLVLTLKEAYKALLFREAWENNHGKAVYGYGSEKISVKISDR